MGARAGKPRTGRTIYAELGTTFTQADVSTCDHSLPRNRRRGEQPKLAPDLRPLMPEHQGRPALTRYQQARRDNTSRDLKKSGKPPSPVQIRAAPPIPNSGELHAKNVGATTSGSIAPWWQHVGIATPSSDWRRLSLVVSFN